MDKILCLRVVAVKTLQLVIPALRRNIYVRPDFPVIAPIVENSVEAVCIHDIECPRYDEVPPVLASRPAVAVLVVHINTSAVTAGKFLAVVL